MCSPGADRAVRHQAHHAAHGSVRRWETDHQLDQHWTAGVAGVHEELDHGRRVTHTGERPVSETTGSAVHSGKLDDLDFAI